MANMKTVFLGTERSGTSETELEVFGNTENELFICIDSEFICLDRQTAIKLVKVMKSEISKIKEVFNG